MKAYREVSKSTSTKQYLRDCGYFHVVSHGCESWWTNDRTALSIRWVDNRLTISLIK
jgi:hypothetical protein